uniref:FoP_duplication domain-containing protein n=1 Tax=Panagrellus redivivus TaxID=6233 RepID=A0A7E4UY55_PANRE
MKLQKVTQIHNELQNDNESGRSWGRLMVHRQQNRRSSDASKVLRSQKENQQAIRQCHSTGQRLCNTQIQRCSDSRTGRRSPKKAQAMKTLHKKHATVTRSPPTNRRPNKNTEAKSAAEILDRELEAYMKLPASA